MFDLNQVSANAARLCHETIMFVHERAYELNRPFMRYGARVYQDGNAFCCCLGDYTPNAIAGFGDTPDEACREFDKAWYAKAPAQEPGEGSETAC